MCLKDENKSFDYQVQLCIFERNYAQQASNIPGTQEALVAEQKSIKSKFKKGHWVAHYKKWKADGRPKKPQEVSAVQVEEPLLMVEEAMSAVSISSTTWWIDSGATKHVTNRREYFSMYEEFETPSMIRAAGSEILYAEGKGHIQIKNEHKEE